MNSGLGIQLHQGAVRKGRPQLRCRVRCHVELPSVRGRTGKLGGLHNPKALLLVHLGWLLQGAAQHLGDVAVIEGAQGAQHLSCSAHHGPQDVALRLLIPHTLSTSLMK